jgi:hypothetical protein
VQVELRIGAYRYCFAFGGTIRSFLPDFALTRRYAARPIACSP